LIALLKFRMSRPPDEKEVELLVAVKTLLLIYYTKYVIPARFTISFVEHCSFGKECKILEKRIQSYFSWIHIF